MFQVPVQRNREARNNSRDFSLCLRFLRRGACNLKNSSIVHTERAAIIHLESSPRKYAHIRGRWKRQVTCRLACEFPFDAFQLRVPFCSQRCNRAGHAQLVYVTVNRFGDSFSFGYSTLFIPRYANVARFKSNRGFLPEPRHPFYVTTVPISMESFQHRRNDIPVQYEPCSISNQYFMPRTQRVGGQLKLPPRDDSVA